MCIRDSLTTFITVELIIPYQFRNRGNFWFFPEFLLCGHTAQGTKMFYDTGSSSMDYSNRMTSLCGTCFPGDVVPWLLAGIWRNPYQNEHTKGSDTPLWDSGEERHRGELANWHRNDTETQQSDRGIVYPIADTSGDFKRLYGCNFAENRPETIH